MNRTVILLLTLPLVVGAGLSFSGHGTQTPETTVTARDNSRVHKAATRTILTVTGTYTARASGVDCPKIKTTDGALVTLNHVSASIALQSRLRVTGYMSHNLNCRGEVLFVTHIERIQ